jgi:hypothetical protein
MEISDQKINLDELNAIKFTPPEGSIKITCLKTESINKSILSRLGYPFDLN